MTEPISRIEAALAGLGAEHEPPVGWEARVLAATAAPRSRRWWWWWLAAPLVAAIALLLWLIPRGPNGPSATLAYSTTRADDRGPTRGEAGTAHIGDMLHLTASSTGKYRELRIYLEDSIVVRCPGGSGCDGADRVEIKLMRSGTYRLVGMAANKPIPDPGGSYDIDLAAAKKADVKIDDKTKLPVD